MTEIVVIFLKQVTFISEFFNLKIVMPLKIILLLLTEIVSLRGENKVPGHAHKISFWYLFNKHPDIFIGEYSPWGGVAK